jgi:hypothetical protein
MSAIAAKLPLARAIPGEFRGCAGSNKATFSHIPMAPVLPSSTEPREVAPRNCAIGGREHPFHQSLVGLPKPHPVSN